MPDETALVSLKKTVGEIALRFVREGGEWKFLERRGSIQMKFFGTTAP